MKVHGFVIKNKQRLQSYTYMYVRTPGRGEGVIVRVQELTLLITDSESVNFLNLVPCQDGYS